MTEWRSIPSYPGYEASDDGRVRSHKRGAPRLLAVSPDDWGYLRLSLWVDGGVKSKRVHQLVCEAFNGPKPRGLQARHLNGNQLDNRAENLQWGTPRENMQDRIRHGRNPQMLKTHCAKGHEFTEVNVYKRGNRRLCRACMKISSDASNAREKAKRVAARANESAQISSQHDPSEEESPHAEQ